MLSTRTSRTLPNAEWYLPAKRQCWREVQYPYHPWSYHIYLHEYHKNQPFMYRYINASFVDGMGYTPLEWGPSKWWLWWFVLKRYFPNSPASKITTIFAYLYTCLPKIGEHKCVKPLKRKNNNGFFRDGSESHAVNFVESKSWNPTSRKWSRISSPKKGSFEKEMNHLPTINFQGILVSFQGNQFEKKKSNFQKHKYI